ncbi:MAG: hypothetical protein AAB681_00240 [Patescibacteria group bacterium]
MYERTYNNRVLKQDESVKKKKNRVSKKQLIFFVVVLGLLSGVFFMLRSPKLQITSVSTVGTEVIDAADIESRVKGQLEGKWLWFFPRTSTFLISQSSLEKNLKKDFSRIETVSIKRIDLHTLGVNIKEYSARYLWCTGEVGDDCYLMDNNGVVYNSAPVFSGTAYVKIITGAPVETIPFLAMTTEEITRVADFVKGLSDINITATVFKVVYPRKIEIDFLHNKDTAQLIVDPTIPTITSLEYLFSALRADPLAGLFRDLEKKLLYIDVRFSNKVVYKFADNE